MSPFDIETGKPLAEKIYPTYTDVFSKEICQISEKRTSVGGCHGGHAGRNRINRLLPDSSPDRFFDVGIAEAACGDHRRPEWRRPGLRPVVAVYSSFLQRGYDQILHDVCIQNLPVLFCSGPGRTGGKRRGDPPGHFRSSRICTSDSEHERDSTEKSLGAARNAGICAWIMKAPIAIRYPRGQAYRGLKENLCSLLNMEKGEILYEEESTLPCWQWEAWSVPQNMCGKS